MKTLRFFLSSTVLAAFAAGAIHSTAWAAAPDLKDKVVLANPDKYQVTLRIGGSQRHIQPRKASVLSPKRYPLNVEFWSGNARTGWKTTPITSAGIFDFRWRGGHWTLLRRPPRSTTTSRTTAYRAPTYRRSTGSYPRTLRSPRYAGRPPAYRGGWVSPRWPLWCRGVWGRATLYRFVRDEEDRDLIRDIIIGREIDDAIRDEIDDALRDRLIAMPYDERRELERAIDDISRLNPDDWRDITTLPADDWDRLRDDIGSEIVDTASQYWGVGAATFRQVVVCGGGAYLWGEHIKRAFKQAEVLDAPEFANARGFYRFAAHIGG